MQFGEGCYIPLMEMTQRLTLGHKALFLFGCVHKLFENGH